MSTEAPATRLVRRVLEASLDLELRQLVFQLNLAATVLGLAGCVDDIVVPVTRQLHWLQETGQCDAARERLTTEAIRTWLSHRGSFAPSPADVGPILLACGPRDRDLVDLESLALLLRLQRWPCRVLGARVSTFSLTIAAQAADATGVVVMSTAGRGRPHAAISIRAIDDMGIPVFFAGAAFEQERGRRQLPGRYLGTRIAGALALISDTLAPAPAAAPLGVSGGLLDPNGVVRGRQRRLLEQATTGSAALGGAGLDRDSLG